MADVQGAIDEIDYTLETCDFNGEVDIRLQRIRDLLTAPDPAVVPPDEDMADILDESIEPRYDY